MTSRQAILAALNGEIGRKELMEYCFIVKGSDGRYKYKRKGVLKRVFVAPVLDEVILFFNSEGYSRDGAVRAFNHYSMNNWCDVNGKPVRNWRQKMACNWFRNEYKIKHIPCGNILYID